MAHGEGPLWEQAAGATDGLAEAQRWPPRTRTCSHVGRMTSTVAPCGCGTLTFILLSSRWAPTTGAEEWGHLETAPDHRPELSSKRPKCFLKHPHTVRTASF